MPRKRELTTAQKRVLEKRESQRNYARKKGSRKKGGSLILLYIMLVFLLVATLVTLSLTVFFKIDAIEVTGECQYSSDEIITMSGVKNGENLISINKNKVINRIISGLPYIDEVKLTRKLPSKLIIEVSPATEEYGFNIGEQYLYTSSRLRVLTKGLGDVENVILVGGFDLENSEIGQDLVFNNSKQEELFESVTEQISSGAISGITHIYLNDAGEINLVYDGRIIWICGSETDIEKKLTFAYAVSTNPQYMDANFEGTLDLSDYDTDDPSIRSRSKNIDDILSNVFN